MALLSRFSISLDSSSEKSRAFWKRPTHDASFRLSLTPDFPPCLPSKWAVLPALKRFAKTHPAAQRPVLASLCLMGGDTQEMAIPKVSAVASSVTHPLGCKYLSLEHIWVLLIPQPDGYFTTQNQPPRGKNRHQSKRTT
jgi:hypothetical protein